MKKRDISNEKKRTSHQLLQLCFGQRVDGSVLGAASMAVCSFVSMWILHRTHGRCVLDSVEYSNPGLSRPETSLLNQERGWWAKRIRQNEWYELLTAVRKMFRLTMNRQSRKPSAFYSRLFFQQLKL